MSSKSETQERRTVVEQLHRKTAIYRNTCRNSVIQIDSLIYHANSSLSSKMIRVIAFQWG